MDFGKEMCGFLGGFLVRWDWRR